MAQFYKVFHSARWVGERFLIRLNRSLSRKALADLNNQFTDIVWSGEIVQRGGLPKKLTNLSFESCLG